MTDTSASTRPDGLEPGETMTVSLNGVELGDLGELGGSAALDALTAHIANVLGTDEPDAITGLLCELPGFTFCRAWLSVSAASDDVNIEVFEEGVRLTARDSGWCSQAWVPSTRFSGDLTHSEPSDLLAPLRTITALDGDQRVRDMMKYLAKIAKSSHAGPPVRLSVKPQPVPMHETPALGDAVAVFELHVDIPDQERVVVKLDTVAFWDWRRAFVTTDDDLRDPVTETVLSGDMLTALGKLPKIALGLGVRIDWDSPSKGFWTIVESLLDFPPHGIMLTMTGGAA